MEKKVKISIKCTGDDMKYSQKASLFIDKYILNFLVNCLFYISRIFFFAFFFSGNTTLYFAYSYMYEVSCYKVNLGIPTQISNIFKKLLEVGFNSLLSKRSTSNHISYHF